MKIEARVTKANEEKGFAIFDSITIAGQVWLILDRGQVPDIPQESFHPPQQLLTDESGHVISRKEPLPPRCHYLGEIDIRPYLELPASRRGFVLID